MRKNFKRFIACLLTVVTTFCFTFSASAEEATTGIDAIPQGQLVSYEVTSDGIQSVDYGNGAVPYSSISGFNQGTLGSTYKDNYIVVDITASGTGGMGITIKTFSSWNGYMNMLINTNMGDVYVDRYAIYSNEEVQFHDLVHWSPRTIEVTLQGIPEGQSVFIQVWVYG